MGNFIIGFGLGTACLTVSLIIIVGFTKWATEPRLPKKGQWIPKIPGKKKKVYDPAQDQERIMAGLEEDQFADYPGD